VIWGFTDHIKAGTISRNGVLTDIFSLSKGILQQAAACFADLSVVDKIDVERQPGTCHPFSSAVLYKHQVAYPTHYAKIFIYTLRISR